MDRLRKKREKTVKGIFCPESNIHNQGFTQEALNLFGIIEQKLVELHIEPNEAKEYFRQFVEKIQEAGFIPPLIINLLRNTDNNYQTLIVSQNLSPEEEKIIASCVKPIVIATNEIIQQTENKKLSATARNVVPFTDFTNPFSNITADIYNESLKATCGNSQIAQEFAKKAVTALEKVFRIRPLPATNRPYKINKRMFEQPILQVNPAGILAHLEKERLTIERKMEYIY